MAHNKILKNNSKKINIALVGNPNVGKSTLFNTITKTRQHIGNWPGKTVEKKYGIAYYNGNIFSITDLPGIYSLDYYSEEERIAMDFMLKNPGHIFVQIIDSSNIKRNLYLTTQLIGLCPKLVIALNFSKYAASKGTEIDEKALSKNLGIPVVKIEAHDKNRAQALLDKVIEVSDIKKNNPLAIYYGKKTELAISEIENALPKKFLSSLNSRLGGLSKRKIAIAFLENDKNVMESAQSLIPKSLSAKINKARKSLEAYYSVDIDVIMARARFGYIDNIINKSVKNKKKRKSFSDKIDHIVTNKILGLPIFLLIILLMFYASFGLAQPLANLIDAFLLEIKKILSFYLTSLNSPEWVISFFLEGIIGGVGSVILFLPNIFMLFFFIALIEDTGYMARAAFIMDRLMKKMGLHGKACIPMILGFGCNVPAIMATRTLKSRKDRILAIILNPFMSCNAKLPVYTLFISAFFPRHKAIALFLIYFLGIIVAFISGNLFKKTVFKKDNMPFIMELPPYRLPRLTSILINMWHRGKSFVKKAGTTIFMLSMAIWALGSLPFGVEYASRQSLAGTIGNIILPIFKPLGFGTWQAAISLIFGLGAKEIIVGTFGIVYGNSGQNLITAIRSAFTPLSSLSFMAFILLYIPCISTLSVIKKETNSWKWPIFVILYNGFVAWVMSFLIYQTGLLLGFS